MSLSSENCRDSHIGTGLVDTYNYTFKIFAATDLRVIVVDDEGEEETLVLGVDYSVTGVGSSSGGSITLLDGDLADGFILVIKRVRPLTQSTRIRNQSEFYAATHEDVFDKIVMITQQLNEKLVRAFQLAESADPEDFDPHLPAEIIAESVVVINEAGDGLELIPFSTLIGPTGPQGDPGTDGADGDGFINAGPFTVTENTTQELSGEVYDSDEYIQIDYVAQVRRGTSVFSRLEYSFFFIDGAWEAVNGGERFPDSANFSGVTFDIDPVTGQIDSTANNSGDGNAIVTIKKTLWPT
jgi:hypothetical protein